MIEHSLVRSILVPDIVALIVKHFHLSERAALDKFYRSTTGAALADEATGLYGQSALHIFGLYMDELGIDANEVLKYPEITSLIPHRVPFLFVDTIESWNGETLVCRKTFRETEPFFAGHYPGFPIVPGVILCEAAMQTGAALLTLKFGSDGVVEDSVQLKPVVAKMGEVRFKQKVVPNDTIEITASVKERMADILFLHAKVTKHGKLVLQFDFACAMVS